MVQQITLVWVPLVGKLHQYIIVKKIKLLKLCVDGDILIETVLRLSKSLVY